MSQRQQQSQKSNAGGSFSPQSPNSNSNGSKSMGKNPMSSVPENGMGQSGIGQSSTNQTGMDNSEMTKHDLRETSHSSRSQTGWGQINMGQSGSAVVGTGSSAMGRKGSTKSGMGRSNMDQSTGRISMDQSIMGRSSMSRSSMDQSGMGERSMGQSSLGQSSMGQRGLVKPVMGQSGMGQSGFGQSGMGRSGMSQSGKGQKGMSHGVMVKGGLGQMEIFQSGGGLSPIGRNMSHNTMGQNSMAQNINQTAMNQLCPGLMGHNTSPSLMGIAGMPVGGSFPAMQGIPSEMEMQAMEASSMQMFWPSVIPSNEFPVMSMMMPQTQIPPMPLMYMIYPQTTTTGTCPGSLYYNWPPSSTGLCTSAECPYRTDRSYPSFVEEQLDKTGMETVRDKRVRAQLGDGFDPREGPCVCDPPSEDDSRADPCTCDPELDAQLRVVFESETERAMDSDLTSLVDSRPQSERVGLGVRNQSGSSVDMSRCLDKCVPSNMYFCREGTGGSGEVECQPGPCPPPGTTVCDKCALQAQRGGGGVDPGQVKVQRVQLTQEVEQVRGTARGVARSLPARSPTVRYQTAYRKEQAEVPRARREPRPSQGCGAAECDHPLCPYSKVNVGAQKASQLRPKIFPQLSEVATPRSRPVSEENDTESMRLRLGDLSPGEDIVYHLHCKSGSDSSGKPFVTKVIPCDDPLAYALNDAAREVAEFRRRMGDGSETLRDTLTPRTPSGTNYPGYDPSVVCCSCAPTVSHEEHASVAPSQGLEGSALEFRESASHSELDPSVSMACCPNTEDLCNVIRAVALGGMSLVPSLAPYVERQRGGGGGEGAVAVKDGRNMHMVNSLVGMIGNANAAGAGTATFTANAATGAPPEAPTKCVSLLPGGRRHPSDRTCPGLRGRGAISRRPAPTTTTLPPRHMCQCNKTKGSGSLAGIRKSKHECCVCRNGSVKSQSQSQPDVEVLQEGRRGAKSDVAAYALVKYLTQEKASLGSSQDPPTQRRVATSNAAADAVKILIEKRVPSRVEDNSEPSTPARRRSGPARGRTDAERPDAEMRCFAACCPCTGTVATGVVCVCDPTVKCCSCERRADSALDASALSEGPVLSIIPAVSFADPPNHPATAQAGPQGEKALTHPGGRANAASGASRGA